MAKLIASIITVIAVTGSSLLSDAPSAPVVAVRSVRTPVGVSGEPTISVTGADASDRVVIDRAVALFLENGLLLPDLDVQFRDDVADCKGHDGLFQQAYNPWRVLICSDAAYVPAHELAHAWEAAHLDDDDRAAYVEFRGLGGWDDRDLPWGERGREDAAFMIQQNLTATYVAVDSPRWQERTAAYEFLTGLASPQLGRD